MPNTIAYLALILWPIVTFALFANLRPGPALIWSLLGGYLLLPVNTAFDFAGIPALDKDSIVNLSVFAAALIYLGARSSSFPKEWWVKTLLAIYVLSPLLTYYYNRDFLVFGDIALPGMRPYDAFSSISYRIIDVLPFLLAYNILNTARAQQDLLRIMAITLVGYSVLMLIEVRLSPQFHNWVYGFFPHSWVQQVRDGAFRPVVFLGHGLEVAIFSALAIIAMAYFAKTNKKVLGVSARLWLLYLLVVLILCRSLGALILTLGALGVLTALRSKQVAFICAFSALAVLIYPAMRGANLVPIQALGDQVSALSKERAASLQTRIDNENALLERANERPVFGWGGYGRNRVRDEFSGNDLSITDGEWIIVIGQSGWLGYVGAFGLLCIPVIYAWRSGAITTPRGSVLALILIVNLVDSLPNTSVHNHTWLIAGTIMSSRRRAVGQTRSSVQENS